MSEPERKHVRFVYWPGPRGQSAMAIGAVDRMIAVLPQQDDAYWHEFRAHRVVEVTAGDPPEIHLEPDEERTSAFYDNLPESVIIDAGRDGDSGRWHAEVYESQV